MTVFVQKFTVVIENRAVIVLNSSVFFFLMAVCVINMTKFDNNMKIFVLNKMS